MSADYEVVGALVGVTLGIAALPIIGAGYALYKGSEAAYRLAKQRQRRKEEERRVEEQLRQVRNVELYNRMLDIRREYQDVFSNHEQRRLELECSFNQKMESSAATFENKILTAGIHACQNLETEAAESMQTSVHKFENMRQEQALEYEREIHRAFENIKCRVQQGQNDINIFTNEFQEDIRLQTYAEGMISEAKAVVALYHAETSENCDRYEHTLKSAISNLGERNYELAYSQASEVSLECLQKLEEAKSLQLTYYQLQDEIEDRLFTIKERLAKSKKAQVTVENEIYEYDLTNYEPDLLAGCEVRLLDFQGSFKKLKGFQRENISALRILSAKCAELDEDVLYISKLAVAKCIFAASENSHAEIIEQALLEQGYQMEDYAYEADVEGNAMHVNFFNPMSGEKLTVVLLPSENGVQISVHNYGDGISTTGNSNTQRAVQTAIESSLGRYGHCTGVGQNSAYVVEADLDYVRNQESSTDGAARKLAQTI